MNAIFSEQDELKKCNIGPYINPSLSSMVINGHIRSGFEDVHGEMNQEQL